MAGINLEAAFSTLTSGAFLKSAVLVVAGALLAQVVTNYLKGYKDIQMKGGDAVYSAVAALLMLVVVPGGYGRTMALGSASTGVRVVLRDFGVV